MRLLKFVLTVITAFIAAAAVADPPKLVSSSPQLWAVGVNAAAQKTVAITFDQAMRAGFADWIGHGILSPASNLKTTVSPDLKTASIDVTLQPGKVFILALNEKGIAGVGFQNEKGLSLAPTFLVFQTAGTVAPDDAPPRVVATVPAAYAQQVDAPKMKAVTIVFDRPMNTKKHGLHLTENNTPVDLSKARFQYSADGKAFALAYDFKPSATYEAELNNTHDIGFTSAKRIPLWPIRVSFTTAPGR